MRGAFLFGFFCVMAGCTDPHHQQTNSALQSLLTVVETTDSINATINLSALQTRVAEVDRIIAEASSKGDTLNETNAQVLYRFAQLSPQMRSAEARSQQVAAECKRTSAQLTAMLHDHTSGAMPTDSVKHHIDTEFQYVEQLSEAVTSIGSEVDSCVRIFDELLPRVRLIIDP